MEEQPNKDILDLDQLEPKKREDRDKLGTGTMGQVHRGKLPP
jgi:hypothetical protein